MDFVNELQQHSKHAENVREKLKTEDATKMSLIIPFFKLLGYDVYNPEEFEPEFTADAPGSNSDKVDFAILIDGKPTILIEAKKCGEPLDKYAKQLFKYFGATDAKFAILTNGLEYKFYSDLKDLNKMDAEPFFAFDVLEFDESDIDELKRFARKTLDVEATFSAARELMYIRKVKDVMRENHKEPTEKFLAFMMKEVYDKLATQKAKDEFRPIIKRGFSEYINDTINETLKKAMRTKPDPVERDSDNAVSSTENESPQRTDEVVSTFEELEAFAIVKSLLRDMCDVNRVTYRHTNNYKVILFDDNKNKRICRLWFKGKKKYITTPDVDMNPVRHDIESLNDIYKFAEHIREVCKRYL